MWDNHFTARIRVTNSSLQSIAVTDIKGEYMTKGTTSFSCIMSCDCHVTVM